MPKKSLTDRRIIFLFNGARFLFYLLYCFAYLIYTFSDFYFYEPFFFQFTCLLQGLSSVPCIFTNVVGVTLAYHQVYGIRIAVWINDFILISSLRWRNGSLCRPNRFAIWMLSVTRSSARCQFRWKTSHPSAPFPFFC